VPTWFAACASLHDLTEPSNSILAGSSHADDGMDEAVNVCCASSASQSEAFQTLIPCMHAAAPNAREPIDCEEKRDPRERPGCRKMWNGRSFMRAVSGQLPKYVNYSIRAKVMIVKLILIHD
jgi:hypothetical protein